MPVSGRKTPQDSAHDLLKSTTSRKELELLQTGQGNEFVTYSLCIELLALDE